MYKISNIEIKTAEVKEDCNRHLELYLESNQPLPTVETKEVYTDSGSHYFFGEDNGLVSFYITHDDDTEHGPNYPWSSRAGVFRGIGFDCVEYACLKDGRGYKFGISLTAKKMVEILSDLGYGLVSVFWWGDESELRIVDKKLLEQIKWGSCWNWGNFVKLDTVYLEPVI